MTYFNQIGQTSQTLSAGLVQEHLQHAVHKHGRVSYCYLFTHLAIDFHKSRIFEINDSVLIGLDGDVAMALLIFVFMWRGRSAH